jgi:hypothetical protein
LVGQFFQRNKGNYLKIFVIGKTFDYISSIHKAMEKCNSKLLLIEEINAITSLQHYIWIKKDFIRILHNKIH